MSCVHYKFSSKLDYNTVTFDGLHITLNELKKQIMGRERLKATDCDLQITNAQTREEYTDDEAHIPKHSSVIVRRTPIGGVKPAGRTFIVDRSDTAVVGSSRPTDSSPSMSLAQLAKTANLVDANASEEDKIKAMMSQSNHEYDPIHYSKKAVGPPPAHYTCFRCGKAGHYIRQCPMLMIQDKSVEGPKPVRISKGIPQSFMVKAEPGTKGAMLTSTGEYAIPAIDAEAYAQGKKERPPFVPHDQSSSEDDSDPIPDELLCPICNDLMTDAVVIPCCGNSYCDDWICSVLFENRMGCLNEEVPEETQKFIFSVGEMFRLSPILVLFPKSTWPYLPFWKQFVVTWDNLFEVAGELVQKKMEEIQEKVDLHKDVEGAYLTHLLLSDQMTVTEILGSITELLLAGVDTTSNTISWCLYLLAKDPEIQEQLYQEVISVCPGDKVPISDDIAKMPYLKAVIRETLRLYPVVPGNARISVEDEIVVGDYLFPKKTLFHLCHYTVSYDENVFPNPHAFQPQRWLRGAEEKIKQQHPFGSVPFGFGIRACLGRRVAELEMYLILSRLIKQYEVRPDPAGTTVKPITRTLLCPAKPINLQFLDRRDKQEESRAAARVTL